MTDPVYLTWLNSDLVMRMVTYTTWDDDDLGTKVANPSYMTREDSDERG